MRMAKKVQSSLTRAHCEYDVVAHRHSSSSLETARVAGVPAERVAKSIILDDHHGHYNPAQIFDDCERGAVRPWGESYGLDMVIDPLLTRQKDIYLEAGNHNYLLHMSMPEFLKMVPHAEVRELSH